MDGRLQEIEGLVAVNRVEPFRPELERCQHETRLEGRWRRVFENSAIGIALTDLEGRFLSANAAYQGILGYTEEELQALTFLAVTHEDDREGNQALVAQLLDGSRQQFQLEKRYRRKDGRIIWVSNNVSLVPGDANSPRCLMAICEDISARKRAEEELHAAKARFEGILGIAEDAIISVDSNQRIVLFNQGAEKVFGYTQAEILGKSLELLLPQRFAGAHRQHLAEFAQAPEVARAMGQRREVFGVRKDGREFPAEASISKLALGSDLVFTVILRDITERKRAAEALRASEHLARGQLDALTHTLDALAQESEPDKLLEHVLRTIADQTGAHSVSVWERKDDSRRLALMAVIEGGRFQTRDDAVHAGARLSMLEQDHPVWSEVLRSRQHAVLEDIDQESARVRIGSAPDAPWHRVLEDTDRDPARALLKKHLRELGVRAVLFVPMLISGQVAGIIGVRFQQKRPFRREDIELTRALAHQAMLAVQLRRLSQQSRQSAIMAERNRVARDIHDTLAQGFTGVIVQLEAAADATAKGLPMQAEEHLDRAGDLAREGLREARRSLQALRPQALEENTLREALEGLLRKMTAGTAVQGEFAVQGQPWPLPIEWEENLLRIGQEVLTNVLRHAQASEFKTRLVFDPREVRLELRDNGRGFDPASRHDGFGLSGMRERVEEMGGQLTIDSARGQGTAIRIRLPLAKLAATSRS